MSEEHSEYGQKYVFSSGIEAIILPFPSMRFEKFIKQAKKKFPLPKPPKKEIDSFGGKEKVNNLTDETYLKKKQEAENKQDQHLAEKILRISLRDCVELDVTKYEDIIIELEEDNEEEYPQSILKRKVQFLTDYAIRSAGDFQALTKIATELMKNEQVTEVDVAEEVDSF